MGILSKTITKQEFWTFTEQHPDKNYELIDGVIVEMPSPHSIHGAIVTRLIHFLMAYLMQNDIGFTVAEKYEFALTETDIFCPDIAYISYERSPIFPKKFDFAPDIAVEVVSPSNTSSEIDYKVKTFIAHGTQVAWVLYPSRKEIAVYTPEEDGLKLRHLTVDDMLDGGTVLSGFSVRVEDIFPNRPQE